MADNRTLTMDDIAAILRLYGLRLPPIETGEESIQYDRDREAIVWRQRVRTPEEQQGSG